MVIAIDGYSSCGKSTLAKQLAQRLQIAFIDTGAMYRAVTLYFLENNINLSDESQVKDALDNIHITFKNENGNNTTYLNGENVTHAIRQMNVSNLVSEVATIGVVRRQMVELQRKMVSDSGVVMDGRDIGTVVFPHADYKFFVTADPIIRAQRRYLELVEKGEHIDIQDILSNLSHRDFIDSTREDSPLKQADDAIVIDNSNLTIEEQLKLVVDIVLQNKAGAK